MAFNLVKTKDNEILLDLTEDTVKPENLLEGIVAHDKHGEKIIGIGKILSNAYPEAEEVEF